MYSLMEHVSRFRAREVDCPPLALTPAAANFVSSVVAYPTGDAGLHQTPARDAQDESPSGRGLDSRNQVRRVPDPTPHRRRHPQGLHPQRSRLGKAVLRHRRRLRPPIGEVVVVHEGRTNFSELQAELAGGRQDRLLFYAFDLLWLDGQDLRKTSQLARKELLRELFDTHELEPLALYSEHAEGDGQELFEAAARLNFEGIISKRVDALYRSERTEAWWKVKTVQREKFPVVGFVKDPTGVAALYLGKKEGEELVYIGKVGTGWDRTTSGKIRKALDTVVSPKSKLSKPLKKNQGRHGSTLYFRPRWNIATSPPKGCCALVRSKDYRRIDFCYCASSLPEYFWRYRWCESPLLPPS